MTRRLPFCTALLLCLTALAAHSAETIQSDICVFGGTSGGIAAAVQASRMGKSVVIVNPTKYLGGLTTGGLGATDIGNKAAVGGISREFYHAIAQHYAKADAWNLEKADEYFSRNKRGQAGASSLEGAEATMWTFEPHVAEDIYFQMLRTANVPIYFSQQLASVTKSGLRITEIRSANGTTFRAKMFIDGTYEGDLLAEAGCSYHVGREANATYEETLNGVRAQTPSHQFTVAVDPYKKPGNPASGLLPFIQPGDGGKPGDGDKSVQAYNHRLCFTTDPANRMPLVAPPGYKAENYELLARYIEALIAAGQKPSLGQFWAPIAMPNHKTDINNRGGFSTDFIGRNYDYPEADYAKREQIAKAHENYIRGFLWFMATTPRVPEAMRNEMLQWGPSADEFIDTAGWPREMYVREARRLISDYVMTEHNCRGKVVAEDPVGLGAYNMDSHNCQRIVKNGRTENEGDVQVGVSPYPVSYRSIVPKATECDNLFVPVCLSSSHIAFGSIRMEPVFMILGQSAATAAVMAIDDKLPVQKVDYAKLRARLLADKQVLVWTGPVRSAAGKFIDPKSLPGIALDDQDGERKGDWGTSTSIAWKVGSGYLHDGDASKGNISIAWTPDIPSAGAYEILISNVPNANRASNTPVTIAIQGGATKTVKVNQKERGKDGWATLGKYQLPKGKLTTVTISNKDTDGHVIADGVQFLPVK